MPQYAIGLDLGGTSIKAALVEKTSGPVLTERIPTEAQEGAEHVLDQIIRITHRIFAASGNKPIRGIGIGAPGTINKERTHLIYPPNIPGWTNMDLCAALQQRLQQDIMVVVENDANAAALGSAHYGAGLPHDSFIMVTLGTGVGGAIIYNNTIFRGSTGAAGEIGHMTIDYRGPEDEAGVAGAIEAYLGQRFLSRHAEQQLLDFPDSPLHRIPDLTPEKLSEAADAGDDGATHVLAWAGHKLGCILGSCINLLDIRTVIVGGGVSAAGNLILNPARTSILQYIKPGMREGVTILQETLGNEAGMLGAAYLVFELLDEHASTREGL